MGLYMHGNTSVSEGQKRVSDPLELQAFVSCPIRVLVIELGSSTRAVWALSCWFTSPAAIECLTFVSQPLMC